MLTDPNPEKQPIFSIVVAVYDHWDLLDGCLASLSKEPSSFEVIVVDDGSHNAAPAPIVSWIDHFPINFVRQEHRGIAAARNLGSQSARGRVILFLDADSRVKQGCLKALADAVASSPQDGFFQLNLSGDCSMLTGRAEQLRLSAIQGYTLQPDGRIRYLNTAGFAVRREILGKRLLFDPTVTRAEDTLLLAELSAHGVLPLFVHAASVQHIVPVSLLKCFKKDLRSGYLERRAYDLIRSKRIAIRISNPERLRMLRSMWRISAQAGIGRPAWFVLVMRQLLQRIASSLPWPRGLGGTDELTGRATKHATE